MCRAGGYVGAGWIYCTLSVSAAFDVSIVLRAQAVADIIKTIERGRDTLVVWLVPAGVTRRLQAVEVFCA